MYTVIESLTQDGRDRSLDYRITGFHVPRGSWDARVLDEVAPAEDEIVLPKTSSNVFVSTNIDYLLRNMAKRQLIVAGFLTDQCVSSAVRDACDLGYLVTLATDATATCTAERHAAALASTAARRPPQHCYGNWTG
jgi:ureidoacrylate peracid hydrolase